MDDFQSDQDSRRDPLILLGTLRADVGYLKQMTEKTQSTVEKIAADISEMKISNASEAGGRKAMASMSHTATILLSILTGVITAWGTVKAMAASLSH